MKYYVTAYLLLTACTVALLYFNRSQCVLFSSSYRSFLLIRWKLITFFIGAGGSAIIAPYTGDPTWDYFDALFMAILTFITAPWATGVIWKALRRQSAAWELYAAVCLWLFSASWSYDLYILLRDGTYGPMWLENLYASSFLYILAGLFWNLEWREGRGVILAFLHDGWPQPPEARQFGRIVWYVLPVALLVAWLMIYFVLIHMGW